MAANGNVNHGSIEQLGAPTSNMDATNSTGNLSKDEVGWYFVEQYYTTLSKSPEKLHLFYGKPSQFVYGQGDEVAHVSVGRDAIRDKIKSLDFQDCKVRISNVDSQASLGNIVIQVIGETSNKAGEPRKFVQTFVLAQQPSGYFVLNDILRYIKDDSEDSSEEAPEKEQPAAAETVAPTGVTAEVRPEAVKAMEPAYEDQAQPDADAASEKPQEPEASEKSVTPAVSAAAPAAPADETEGAAAKLQAKSEAAAAEAAAAEVAQEEAKKPEVQKAPSPAPVQARAPPPAAEPEKPKGPPKPMTWASRAAAAAGPPRPVVPLTKPATQAAAPRPTAPATAQPPAAATSQPIDSPATPTPRDQGSEWQTAGADSKRQNRPQSVSTPPTDKEGTMAYIKSVTDKVQTEDLRATLASYGELAYFDINRNKTCAFVEFETQAGYNAAVAANPHTVNGETIVVEQRRPKANAYGGSNYNVGRGGLAGRGRGGYEGGRSGSQGGGRGGFGGQSRGRGGAPRGRGASQAVNV